MLFSPHFLRGLALLFQFYFFLLVKAESICEVKLRENMADDLSKLNTPFSI